MKFTKMEPSMNESIENFKKSEIKEGLELKDEKITPVADVVFSDALSQHEVVKQELEKKMKEKDKEVEEMVKDQEKEGPDKVKEDGTPKGLVVESLLEGYTFDNNEGAYSVHVPSRNELGKLIRGLKESNVEYKISRSKTEGFRYDFNFTYKPIKEAKEDERQAWEDDDTVNTLVDFIEDMKNNDYEELEARKEKYLAVLEKSLEMTKQFAGKADEGLGLLGIGDVNVNLDASGTNAALGFGGGKGTNESLEESKETKEDINITNNDSPSRVDTKEITKEEPKEEPKATNLDDLMNEEVEPDDTDNPLDESTITEEGKEVGNLLNQEIKEEIDEQPKEDEVDDSLVKEDCEECEQEEAKEEKTTTLRRGPKHDRQVAPLEEDVKIMLNSLDEFEPWSGAVEVWNKIVDAGQLDTLAFALEDIYPDGITTTQLNDLLRFDGDWCLSLVGLSEEKFED